MYMYCTVKSLNSGHYGTRLLVHYRELSFYWEIKFTIENFIFGALEFVRYKEMFNRDFIVHVHVHRAYFIRVMLLVTPPLADGDPSIS